MRFKTKTVHVGQEKDKSTGATIPPIHLTTTYTHDKVGVHKGFEYSRTGNPTRHSLERLIASLEDAKHGLAFASGMAAIHSLVSLLEKDSHLILSQDVYGGTFRLVDKFLATRGISYSLLDTTNIDEIKNALNKNTKMIFIETPTNPLLKIMDIEAIKKAVGPKILFVVDNTFATPYFQKPLGLGADIVVHSATKYLSGHSDVISGLLATNKNDLYKKMKFYQNSVGAVPSPLDCYLTIRGIKTLALRMQAHQNNALKLAMFLKSHPKVKEVYYPGLPDSKTCDLVRKQMTGFSGIVSFKIKGGLSSSRALLENLKIFSLAESLGGVESLASLPSKMTHASFSLKHRKKIGISDNLIRLSVGIEDERDLIDDVIQALSKS